MKLKISHFNLYYFTPVLLAGVFLISAFSQSANHQPLFSSLDNFVLFASEELNLEKEVQVSSGDLGSNKDLDIQKDAIVNGNLFADKISIDKNTIINGNVSYNKLKTQKDVQILGQKISPVSLPIAILPDISDFPIGTQDFKFQGENNTLAPGNYRNITLEKNAKLILSGGTYNLNKLELKDNSVLVFNTPTILNIQFKLKGGKKVAIIPSQNLNPQDLSINYLGIKSKHEKEEKEDDDEEINNLFDNKEKKDHRDGKIGRPVVFGQNSFLNFKLLTPKANVHIGEESTLRGNVWGRKVRVGKEGILSLDIATSLQPKIENIVLIEEGEKFIVNQIILQLILGASFDDAVTIANSINGRIVGIIPSVNLYQIEITTRTVDELDNLIQQLILQQNPKIKIVTKNNIINLIQ